MDSIKRVTSKIVYVARSRAFAISMLSVFTAAIVLFVSLNLNHVLVVAHERDSYLSELDELQEAGQEDNEMVEPSLFALTQDGENEITTDINLVKVNVDGILLLLCTDAKTVADVLSEADINLVGTDEIDVELTDKISSNFTINISRVVYEEYEKTTSVGFETVKENTNTLLKGKTKVKQEGSNGSKVTTYKKRIVNGILEATDEVSHTITVEPTNKVVLVGTKVVRKSNIQDAGAGIALDANGVPLNYKKLLTGEGTAYTSDRGDSGPVTSTGQRAQRGIVAVDPKLIPYGTKLYITSADGNFVYGYAVAGDTGGAVMSGRVLADLFYDTYGECTRFGRRDIKVYVLS